MKCFFHSHAYIFDVKEYIILHRVEIEGNYYLIGIIIMFIRNFFIHLKCMCAPKWPYYIEITAFVVNIVKLFKIYSVNCPIKSK